MAVPKKRRSHTRQAKRRSHQALTKVNYASCTNCGEPVLAHRVCGSCHFYRGKLVSALAE